ncbi:ABC transporter substrate-binding protein [Kitasatospora sp. NPDC056783]|uniref:ABC transporter substrate-binding protein n=1 Tax=Kitasatospora sp. NPDC056783 TaxID=3345943 RepID=UPI0036C5F4A9
MSARSQRNRLLAAGLVAASVSLALTACSSGKDEGSGAPNASATVNEVKADPKLASLVPDDAKAAGKLLIGADASYAPDEFKDDSGKVIGLDVDLANAIAAKLGLKAEVQDSGFTAILPGIQSNKFQLGMSSFTDTKEREEVVDMVTYFNSGSAVAVKKGNPEKIDAKDLCGKKVAVQTGTTQADEINDTRNPDCVKAGKPGIQNGGDKFDLQTDVTNAVVSGRDQAMMADSQVVDYAVKQSGGQLEKVGETYGVAPYGVALAKGSKLTPAIQGAVQSLIDDGTYKQILTKWGVEAGAIDKSVINSVAAGH